MTVPDDFTASLTAGPSGLTITSTETFSVLHAAVVRYDISAANAEEVAGSNFDITVTALDEFDNTATTHASSVLVASQTVTITNGVGILPVVFTATQSVVFSMSEDVTLTNIDISATVSVEIISGTFYTLLLPSLTFLQEPQPGFRSKPSRMALSIKHSQLSL